MPRLLITISLLVLGLGLLLALTSPDSPTQAAPRQGTPTGGATPTVTCPVGGWSLVSSPNPGPDGNQLLDVAALAPNNVWAVGLASQPPERTLILHWDGSVWSQVPSPNVGTGNNALKAVAAVAPNNIWAAGYAHDAGGLVQELILHWDGTTWSLANAPPSLTGRWPIWRSSRRMISGR